MMAGRKGGGQQKNATTTTTTTAACAVAVIAGRSLRDREAVHRRIRCALLAPGLVDAVAITDPAFGTDPVFRAELILPTTLRVETYTHLSVEMLDEEMTKVVGFGTMDFQELVVENKGKIPGKWIAMWDDARENVVGHVCIRVTLEVVNRKEKLKNGVQTTPAAARESAAGVVAVTGVFALVTIATMLGAVVVALWGAQRLHFPGLARFGQAIAGGVVLCCGLAITVLGL